MERQKKTEKKRTGRAVGKPQAKSPRKAAPAAGSGYQADKYQFLIEATNTGYVILNEMGRVLDANEEYVRMTGHAGMKEILGRRVTDWTAPYDLKRNAAEVAKCMQTGSVRNLVIDYIGPAGKTTPVEINATVLPDTPARIFTVCRDITDRRQAEAALKASEERWRALVETTVAWFWETDATLRHTYTNRFVLHCLGYEPAEFLRMNIADLVHPDDLELLEGIVRDAQTRRTGWSGKVLRWRHKDGSWRSIESSGTPVFERQGNFSGLLGVDRDITDRMQQEQALAESEANYRTLFDSSTDGIFILDMQGRFLDANRTAYERLGYTREEILGMTIVQLDDPTFAPHVPGRLRQIREQGVAVFESAHRRKDGTMMPVEVNSRLLDYRGQKVFYSIIRDITERKRAEDRLKESEARLNTILDNVGAAIFIKDMQYRYTYANRKTCEIFGKRPEDIVGKGDEALFTASSVEEIVLSDRPVIERGEVVMREEIDLMATEGEPRTYWTVKLPLRDATGAITGLCGISTDITDRKAAERQLSESQRMLRNVIDAIPVRVFWKDLESRFLGCNNLFAQDAGRPGPDSLLGEDDFAMGWAEQAELYRADDREVMRTGIPKINYEEPQTTPSGDRIWLRTSKIPLRDERGTIYGVLGTYEDITVRKRIEEALQRSEEQFRNLAESLPLTVFEMDLQGRFTYVNRAALEAFGYTQQDFDAGMFMSQMVAPEDRERQQQVLARCLGGDPGGYVEYKGLRKDGTTFPITVASSPILRDGRPFGLRGIVTDLTVRKQLEEERLKAQKLESIGTLAGGIAHDFNNLLQGVFGYISMAKITLDRREKSLAMLEQAEKALHQSVNLTSQLLTFSKGGKPVKRTISLGPVIENAVKFALSGSRVTADMSIEPDLPPVDADEGQIGQVVQNIVLNADQAMPLGGSIAVTAKNVASAPGTESAFVEITVTDQGTGIPPEHLPRIFDPYFSTKEKGSGLGLATSYSIIKNHGGEITVASELGMGTTFTIRLPAGTGTVEGASAPAPERRVRSGRVLVMDDEEVVRTVAAELLMALGQDAEFAGDGETAIRMFREARAAGRPFDVVILDLTIRGGMGGLETIRELRRIDSAVKAVMSSGYSNDASLADFRKQGFKAVLKKPYDLMKLREVLDGLME